MKSPKIALEDLPATIRKWRECKEKRLEFDRQSALIKKEETLYKGQIIEALRARGESTEGLVIDDYVTGVAPGTSFRINDWQKLWKYVVDNNAPDIFSLSLSSQGVKSRSTDLEQMGVEIVDTYSLYNRKAGTKK